MPPVHVIKENECHSDVSCSISGVRRGVRTAPDNAGTEACAEKIIVVGAGPSGIICAAALARLGYQVEVYEKRPLPDITTDSPHSFTIVLNPKGLGAIRSVGIDTEHLATFPLLACVRHSPFDGSEHAFLTPTRGSAVNFERNGLVAWLLAEAQRLYPGIRWHFGCGVAGVDFAARRLRLEGRQEQPEREVSYDLLIGADGANSAVRAAMERDVPSFTVQRRDADLVYKRFHRFRAAEGGAAAALAGNAKYGPTGAVIHFYGVRLQQPSPSPTAPAAPAVASPLFPSAAAPSPSLASAAAAVTAAASTARTSRANWGFVTLVNHADGSLSGGLSVHRAAQERLCEQQDYESALSVLPLPPPVRAALAASLRAAPWTWGGAWLRCPHLHHPGAAPGGAEGGASGGRALLLGDAAHSISPSMGQGANAALEDVTVLQQVLASLAAARDSAAAATAAAPHADGAIAAACDKPASRDPSSDSPSTLPTITQAAATAKGAAAVTNVDAACSTADPGVTRASPGGPASSSGSLLDALPAAFSAARLADVHALVWLDENARAFRGQMGTLNPYFWMYLAHMYCRPALHRLVPGLVAKPALQVLWEGPVPYTAVVRQMKGDLAALAAGAGLAAAALGVAAARALPYLWQRRAK